MVVIVFNTKYYIAFLFFLFFFRKSLSEMISAESCPISETVGNDETLEMDTEMMEEEEEEEVDAVGTKEDNVEERAYMVTDTKDDGRFLQFYLLFRFTPSLIAVFCVISLLQCGLFLLLNKTV